MTDKIFFFAKFNLPALLALAEQRRGGQTCTCDVSQMPKNGSLNWVIFLTFDDGIEWVFRSPKSQDHCFYSKETSSKILISEASTLVYLKAHTSIPVPEVYAYSGSSDNDIGVPYILQSKAPGRTLSSYDWNELPNEIPELKLRQPLMPISDANRAKVLSQLGSLMAELSIHRFEKIGSLFDDGNGGHTIGECLLPSFTWQDRDSLELERGPFSEECRYYHSLISAFTTHAQELALSPHVFFAPVPDRTDYKSLASYQEATRRWVDFMMVGQKIEHSKNILSYCIAGQFLSDMIPYLSSGEGNDFVLSHPDLHLGNIYVDEDLNITCIIDWSSAATGSVSELLATPSLGTSASPPAAYLTAAYRSGFGQRATEIKLDLPFPDLWKTSERMWYFTRLIRLLSKNDHWLFTSLFELVYNTTSDGQEKDGILWLFHERSKQDENIRLLATLQEDDLTAEELQEKERAWFTPSRIANSDVLAVARKLTLMSEMNPNFLADHRLWQWVEEARMQQNELP